MNRSGTCAECGRTVATGTHLDVGEAMSGALVELLTAP